MFQKKPISQELIRLKAEQIWRNRESQGLDSTPEQDWYEAEVILQYWTARQWLKMQINWQEFWRWSGVHEKNGWDYLELAINIGRFLTGISIPVLLFLSTNYLAAQNNKQQQAIAIERYQQDSLTQYLEQMSGLLTNKNLKDDVNQARTIARARTLSTLRELDSNRKVLLIKFLYEANLISLPIERTIVLLEGADLSGVSLVKANFQRANLSGANLSGANLQKAKLTGANLSDAILKDADLSEAQISGSNFQEAKLIGAKLALTNLKDADFAGADLSGANLEQADLTNTNLTLANLSGANLKNARLAQARLIGANLAKAELTGANFLGADLEEANLREEPKNLTLEQIKAAKNWEKAYYSNSFTQKLGLTENQPTTLPNEAKISRL